MNKLLALIHDKVCSICATIAPKAVTGLRNSLTTMEIVTTGYYDFTDFGVPAAARITQFTVTVTASAVVSIHGFTSTIGSGSQTISVGPGTYIDPASTVIDVSAISGGEITFDVQYYL